MKKNIPSWRGGLRRFKIFSALIVAQILPLLFRAIRKNLIFDELWNYIANHQLSDALELLEKYKITGDLAIFIIACISFQRGAA